MADYANYYKTASQVFERTCAEYDDARKAIEDGQEQIRREEMRKAALRSEQDARKRKENALLAEYNSKNTVLTELIKQSQANEAKRDALLASIQATKEEKVRFLRILPTYEFSKVCYGFIVCFVLYALLIPSSFATCLFSDFVDVLTEALAVTVNSLQKGAISIFGYARGGYGTHPSHYTAFFLESGAKPVYSSSQICWCTIYSQSLSYRPQYFLNSAL
ncbi:unnamed protein product [Cylicostephanus goldi]|uniref:Uncharacterized protein n=1 Tax=Cylicostephanus goldi TaxID=71465 RepID=A0A3P7MXH5_CYLGO|nr:unnamed protein product [Cylicostephanus goldi]